MTKLHAIADQVTNQENKSNNFFLLVFVFSSAQNSRSMLLSCVLTIGKQLVTRRWKLDMSGEGILSSAERECQVSLQRNIKTLLPTSLDFRSNKQLEYGFIFLVQSYHRHSFGYLSTKFWLKGNDTTDNKSPVLSLAISLSSYDKNTSLHYLVSTGIQWFAFIWICPPLKVLSFWIFVKNLLRGQLA